jgi:hypothetical protein
MVKQFIQDQESVETFYDLQNDVWLAFTETKVDPHVD